MARGGVSGTVRARQTPCGSVAKALTSDSAAHKARLYAECTSGLLHQMPETPPCATSCLCPSVLCKQLVERGAHRLRPLRLEQIPHVCACAACFVLCFPMSFVLPFFLVAESIARTTFLLPERGDAAEAGCRRGHLMKRPGSAACQAADIVGRGIRSERHCMTAAMRPIGANGDCGGHPDEAALPKGGETANAAEPLNRSVHSKLPKILCRQSVGDTQMV